MRHLVTFDSTQDVEEHVSRAEMHDLIDMFYRWSDSSFRIVGSKRTRKTRGVHRFDPLARTHVIEISIPAVVWSFENGKRVGGNRPAQSLRSGVVMVLVHELQHANQSQQHSSSETFWRQRGYTGRPCETDARRFVDEHMDMIDAFLGQTHRIPSVSPVRGSIVDHGRQIDEITDVLGALQSVSVKDIVHELRLSGVNNARNVRLVSNRLSDKGITLIR